MANAPLAADDRAACIVAQLTLDEKIQLVTGYMGRPRSEDSSAPAALAFDLRPEMTPPPGAIGSDGFVPGIPRLGIPHLHLAGAGVGVTSIIPRAGAETVSFPSSVAQTATWNPALIREFGHRLGDEARAQGINVMLGAATNLSIEPRSGRNFEYHGEDPILAGTIVREELLGTQDRGVVASVKHFAANFQETGRFVVNSVVEERALREGELLAFEIALSDGDVGAVMTSYNKLNGSYTSENYYLLTEVLKEEWGFRGWVMSDWGAAHSTVPSALAGLDQEFPLAHWFGAALKTAVESGEVPLSRLDDMNHRIVRTLIAVGVMDDRAARPESDAPAMLETALRIAREGTVLLKNSGNALPLPPGFTGSIAVIGSHADVAVPAGGGSAAVTPIGGEPVPGDTQDLFRDRWIPSSPLAGITSAFPEAAVRYYAGTDLDAARALARSSDVVLVFCHQHTTEHADVPSLALPGEQDLLVEAVAAEAAVTIVVLETGGVITMPWIEQVNAVLSAWYPGHAGSQAIADIVSGRVNPSGKTPLTFPLSEADLPHPKVFPMPPLAGRTGPVELSLVDMLEKQQGEYFDAVYAEGLQIGYKWFDGRDLDVLFPFGHGLSYAEFSYDDVEVASDDAGVTLTVTVSNTGSVAGAETVQVYATLPATADSTPRRLVGWAKHEVAPGDRRVFTITVPNKYLSVWSKTEGRWVLPAGTVSFDIGSSSRDFRLKADGPGLGDG